MDRTERHPNRLSFTEWGPWDGRLRESPAGVLQMEPRIICRGGGWLMGTGVQHQQRLPHQDLGQAGLAVGPLPCQLRCCGGTPLPSGHRKGSGVMSLPLHVAKGTQPCLPCKRTPPTSWRHFCPFHSLALCTKPFGSRSPFPSLCYVVVFCCDVVIC